jgi:hypothetical protein
MSANSNRLLALLLWAEVVLALSYWKWWPRPLDLSDLHKNEGAFVLRLPENGILTRMVDRGVKVGLAIPPTFVVEHATVLSKVCKAEIQSTTRVAVCYAAIAVPNDRMAALTSAADKVSVWVEGQ